MIKSKLSLTFWLCVLLGMTAAAAAQTDSFESYEPGTIEGERVGPLGTWRSDGQAEVSRRRASTGNQALRIFGGEQQQITLTLANTRESGIVSLDAERWTRRSPFEFRVEARLGTAWETVYEDDGTAITIGGYNATIEFRVEGAFDALRFTCTAPEGGGILIDDCRVAPLRPMRIVEVTTDQPVLPVLIGNRINPIARIRIVTEGTLEPISLTGVRWTLQSGTQLLEVAAVEAYVGTEEILEWRQPNACFDADQKFGQEAPPAPSLRMTGSRDLVRGDNFVWLSVSLSDHVDLEGWIDAGGDEVTFSNGLSLTPTITEPDVVQRFGMAVRNADDDGVAVFRIPGITTTRQGTLIAVYDIRHDGWSDLPGNIDVGTSRSTDGGYSWEQMCAIVDMGDDPQWRYDGVGDPTILYDENNDVVWVAATWSHGDRSWRGSGPGLEPEDTGQLLLVRSDDNGRTWSEPINITRQVKDPDWAFVLQSPGQGITMGDGTLVFPAQYQLHPEDNRVPHSTIIYSRNQGTTWRIGRGVKPNTTESRVVELEPGTLMLNMRDNRGGSRSIHVSRDLGQTWLPHPSSRGALPEPVCNAGLIRGRAGRDARHPWLAFINPNVPNRPRRHMTLKLSLDGGLTWPTSRHLLLDEGDSAGYASLTMIDEDTIGVLYEGSRAHMTFQRIPLGAVLTEFKGGSLPGS